jgi:hypothetical protein
VRETRARLIVAADQLEAEIEHPPLVVTNPLMGQPLAIPCDIQLGDTPDGEPAVWWEMPPALDEYGLQWDWGDGGTPDQAFWRFIDLADAHDPEPFAAFARRFGTLGLWPYETPKGHRLFGVTYWVPSMLDGIRTPLRYSSIPDHHESWRIKRAGLEKVHYEPIGEWRRWADWLRATVEIAFALRSGRLGAPAHWQALDADIDFSTDPRRQQKELARYIRERLLRWSGLTPAFRWDAGGPRVALELGGQDAVHMPRTSFQIDWPRNTLYPALAAQLLAVVTAGTPIAACSRCGTVHARSRRARTDQPAYCSDECRHEARKATKRESAAETRKRKRAAESEANGRRSGGGCANPER